MQAISELTAAMPGRAASREAAPERNRPGPLKRPSIRAVMAISLVGNALAATGTLATSVIHDATGRMEAGVGAQLAEIAGHKAANLAQGMFELRQSDV